MPAFHERGTAYFTIRHDERALFVNKLYVKNNGLYFSFFLPRALFFGCFSWRLWLWLWVVGSLHFGIMASTGGTKSSGEFYSLLFFAGSANRDDAVCEQLHMCVDHLFRPLKYLVVQVGQMNWIVPPAPRWAGSEFAIPCFDARRERV